MASEQYNSPVHCERSKLVWKLIWEKDDKIRTILEQIRTI